MAITYVSSNARPGDNSTFGGNANNSLLINAVGAATGDLVVVIAQYRGATTIVVDETGGQTWNSLTAFIDAANLCQVRYFWCRWSDETANGNNPNFFANGTAGNPFTCAAHIFRPTTGTNLWGIDVALSSMQYSAPTTPFTVNRTGVTPTNASTVTIASWHTADVNTWNTLTGTGWVSLGDAQNRNATGSGQSATQAYKIMTSAGSTGDVSKNQATNGGDAGVTGIISFYEFSAGYTMTAATGSFALTGNATGLAAGRKVSANAGTFTLTGVNNSLRAIRALQAGSGALTLTGNEATLRSGRILSAQNGAFALTGSAITMAVVRRLSAGAGSFVITGRPAVLVYSGATAANVIISATSAIVIQKSVASSITTILNLKSPI